jgi:hypothetical protein
MRQLAPVAGYLLAVTATVLVWNAEPGATPWWLGISIWGGASILLGAMTGRLGFFLWAFVAIPIAYPFGVGEGFRYSEPLPIWFGAALASVPAALLVAAAALGRRAFDARRAPPRRASSPP